MRRGEQTKAAWCPACMFFGQDCQTDEEDYGLPCDSYKISQLFIREFLKLLEGDMPNTHFVDVAVPVGGSTIGEADMDFWQKVNEFFHKKFGDSQSSGTGFGYRDLQYDVSSVLEGEFLIARMKRELKKEYGEDLVKMSKFEVKEQTHG